MGKSTLYIHFGYDEFIPEWFVPVRNQDYIFVESCSTKPASGTGLWASRVGDPLGWEAWCAKNMPRRCQGVDSFVFRLKDGANVLQISRPEQLESLPLRQPFKLPDYSLLEEDVGSMPSLEQLEQFFASKQSACLHFERLLAEGVDAIELTDCYLFNDILPTWDCNCIFIMNPDIVEEAVVPE